MPKIKDTIFFTSFYFVTKSGSDKQTQKYCVSSSNLKNITTFFTVKNNAKHADENNASCKSLKKKRDNQARTAAVLL